MEEPVEEFNGGQSMGDDQNNFLGKKDDVHCLLHIRFVGGNDRTGKFNGFKSFHTSCDHCLMISMVGKGKIKPPPSSKNVFSLSRNSSLKCQGNTK